MTKKIICAYGVDLDAIAGWLGTYGGEDSPCDISRGIFAGEIGTPRLLALFKNFDIKTSWFVPGHSIESFPKEFEKIIENGHEIGLHGYSHENPISMSRNQEADVLDKSISLIKKFTGDAPRGHVAPWWEFSNSTTDLLKERGVIYDHSLMHNDFHPYFLREGDSWTKIDYSKPADVWMRPLVRGQETDLLEIPANWYLDDEVPMMFVKNQNNSHGFVLPSQVEELWKQQFDWVYREFDYAVFPMTIHPDVSGRPQTLLMHERLIDYFRSHSGVEFQTFEEIAKDYLTKR